MHCSTYIKSQLHYITLHYTTFPFMAPAVPCIQYNTVSTSINSVVHIYNIKLKPTIECVKWEYKITH